MPVRSEQPKDWQADPTALCTNGAYRISEWKNGLLTATVPESYYDQRRLQMSTLVFRFETDAAMRTELLKRTRWISYWACPKRNWRMSRRHGHRTAILR